MQATVEGNTPPQGRKGGARRLVWVCLGAALLALLVLATETPLWLRAPASLLFAVGIPGLLVVLLALGPPSSAEGWLERVLLAGGAGISVALVVVLLMSRVPGGVDQSWLLAAFLLLNVAFAAAILLDRRDPVVESRASDRGLWPALALVLGVAALLRFSQLGYSEFQGDESRVMLRAGELLAGYENALLVHQKAPAEILLSALMYGLDGWVTEWAARVPFALASLWAVAAFFLLARRVLGAAGGVTAALLLALDGYMLAFGRIVQYQSIVILAALLSLILLDGARTQAQRVFGRFALGGLILAGGMLAHYDSMTIVVPALYLMWLTLRGPVGWRRGTAAIALGVLVASGLALIFYVPYVAYPGFESHLRYVVNDRLGISWPYNNLQDVTQRTMLYSSSYYVLFLVVATLGSMFAHYRRALGWIVACALLGLTLLLGVLTYTGAATLQLAGRDLSGLLLVLPLLGVCFLPRLRIGERVAWLWFVPLFAAALFLIERPDTHVYVFFVPWMLVVGAALQRLWEYAPQLGSRMRTVLAAAGALLLLLFAIYPWLMFADASAERLRTWRENRPAAYWYPWALPPERGIFGFPMRNGWKVVAPTFKSGELFGGFEYNTRDETAIWYTRSDAQCPQADRYWILSDTVEPTDDDRLSQMRQAIEGAFGLRATAVVDGGERLRIYDASLPAGSTDSARRLALDESEAAFDMTTRALTPARPGHVLEADPQTPVNARFGEAIRLVGYTLGTSTAVAGESIPITLTWESLLPVYDSYTVFLHIVDPATGGKAGQEDGLPVCGRNLTWQWNPSDVIEDPHLVPIAPDALGGDYRLYVGLYNLDTGERLPVLDENGQPLADFLDLTQVTVSGSGLE